MTARSLGADLVDLTLAAAIAALPAHVLAVAWGTGPLPENGFPASVDGPSLAVRAVLFLVGTASVFVLLRLVLERKGGQGPGKFLFSLRVENGRVVEDREGLDLFERLGVFAGRFARTLVLALSCILILTLWGGAIERSMIQAHQRQVLRTAFSYDAEYDCCAGAIDKRNVCPRLLELWAAIADRSDGKGDIPPRESLLDRCPQARRYSRH